MTSRVPVDFESGIDDVTDVISSQGVSDLSWLDVNVEDYRANEALPKQNLDIIPELQSALSWDGKDPRVPEISPLRPHTVVNRNPLDRPEATLRSNSSIPNRLAAYVMAGMDDKTIAQRMSLEFSPDQLSAHHAEASAIIGQKGLLGNVYVDSKFFPRCAQEGPHRDFVAKTAKRALFVLAKDACGGCVCNKAGSCSSFKKRLTAEVPYSPKLAAHYLPVLRSENRLTSDEAKSVIAGDRSVVQNVLQAAFLRPVATTPLSAPQRIQQRTLPKAPVVTEADVQSFWERRMASADVEARPGPMYLVAAKRMMQGKADINSLRASSDAEIRSLSKEFGILGHTYLDGDALGGVSATYSHLRSMASAPDFVLFRSLSAADASTPELAEISKVSSVVRKRPELGIQHLGSALERAVSAGRVSPEAASVAAQNARGLSDMRALPAYIAEVNLASPAPEARPVDYQPTIGTTLHHGDTSGERQAAVMDPEEVRKSISHLMNTGLAGKRLQAAVLQRYSRADLAQVPSVGLALSKDDGVQGSFFIDPTAYRDYGRGCQVGADGFRKLNYVPNVLASSGCTGCRSQTHPGWCSKYAKTLIRQIPETVRQAAVDRRSLPVVRETAPVRNPVAEFGLESSLNVEIASPAKPGPVISVPSQSIPD